jgi:SAM-dependent methyltransferase
VPAREAGAVVSTLGTAQVIRANARDLPLADNSVDLVVTSPPYFALRSYQDGGEHYAGQIGDEPTPAEFVASLLEVTRECVRVLKPSGSLWVNLGDKYAGQGSRIARSTSASSSAASYSASPESPSLASSQVDNAASASARSSSVIGIDPTSFSQGARDGNRRSRPSPVDGIPGKSLMGIPWRYALACIDDLGLILRAEVIWSKPNGLPESVTDRVRRSHEQWFHFTLEPRYFSAVDEIREAHNGAERASGRGWLDRTTGNVLGREADAHGGLRDQDRNPLGKLPGSVWTIPTEPLRVPDHLGIDHFAAFPTEWPKRIIQGWSPAGVCVECGEGRRPVVDKVTTGRDNSYDGRNRSTVDVKAWKAMKADHPDTITGYACACPEPTADTRPSVILDPFGGTGTTALVAKALGRRGVSVDMSADYCRLAEWRTNDRNQLAKVLGLEKAPDVDVEQLDLFGEATA